MHATMNEVRNRVFVTRDEIKDDKGSGREESWWNGEE